MWIHSETRTWHDKNIQLIAIDLSKQDKLDGDPKAIKQIDFTGNIEKDKSIFFIIEELKEIVLDFSKETVKILWFYLVF